MGVMARRSISEVVRSGFGMRRFRRMTLSGGRRSARVWATRSSPSAPFCSGGASGRGRFRAWMAAMRMRAQMSAARAARVGMACLIPGCVDRD